MQPVSYGDVINFVSLREISDMHARLTDNI